VRLLYFGTDEQCKLEEIRLIQLFGRRDLAAGPLLNCTDGGDGTTKRVHYKRELELLRAAATRQWNNESTRAKKIAGIIESWRNPTTVPERRSWIQSLLANRPEYLTSVGISYDSGPTSARFSFQCDVTRRNTLRRRSLRLGSSQPPSRFRPDYQRGGNIYVGISYDSAQ
jgi:hypothetical protein